MNGKLAKKIRRVARQGRQEIEATLGAQYGMQVLNEIRENWPQEEKAQLCAWLMDGDGPWPGVTQ
jgi:GTPase Era involved in 16S rRNA processing